MAGNDRPYLATLPGILTGIAGILTASLGMLTLSASQGWIGDRGGNGASESSPDPVAPTTAPDRDGDPPSTAATPSFRVSPTQLTFEPLEPREETVTVENRGGVPMTVESPRLSGRDAGEFQIPSQTCGSGTIRPGESCDIVVRFGATEASSARLVVTVVDAPRSVEVPLQGARIL